MSDPLSGRIRARRSRASRAAATESRVGLATVTSARVVVLRGTESESKHDNSRVKNESSSATVAVGAAERVLSHSCLFESGSCGILVTHHTRCCFSISLRLYLFICLPVSLCPTCCVYSSLLNPLSQSRYLEHAVSLCVSGCL